MQGFLLNDFDESKKFYRILGAEEKIRVLAENFGNSYHIGVFTCCRMLETAVKMSGMLSYAEAKEKYPDLIHDRTDEEEINRIPQPTGPVIEPDVKTLTVEQSKNQNFCCLYGAKPSEGIISDSSMVKDFTKTLLNRFERKTLSVTIPDVLEHMKSKDASFEMVTSNELQQVKLYFSHNVLQLGEDKQLSDNTPISKYICWKDIKEDAMMDDYQSKDWYQKLSEEKKELLEALREVQLKQGNV